MLQDTKRASAELSELTDSELRRYNRHIMLPQVGVDGQRKLKASSVLVVGTGGLGSPIAMYLAASGIGRIGLVDFDVVDESNLQRQIIHGEDTIGVPKVVSAAARLRQINPYTTIDSYNEPLSSQNALDILAPYDVILDGTDNFPTRYLLNDASAMLGKPLVYGGIYRFEGQVSVFDARRGPCYRCLLPEPPPPHLVPSCAEAGVLGVLPGTIGTLQATEALKLILGIGEPLIGRLLLYDALDMSFDLITLPKRPACPMCGENPTITELIDYEDFCGVAVHESGSTLHHDEADRGMTQWSVQEVKACLTSGDEVVLVDVREPFELRLSWIDEAVNIPMSQMQARWQEIPRDRRVIVFCHHGIRSRNLIAQLQTMGYSNLIDMIGGIDAWSLMVDPAVPRY